MATWSLRQALPGARLNVQAIHFRPKFVCLRYMACCTSLGMITSAMTVGWLESSDACAGGVACARG